MILAVVGRLAVQVHGTLLVLVVRVINLVLVVRVVLAIIGRLAVQVYGTLLVLVVRMINLVLVMRMINLVLVVRVINLVLMVRMVNLVLMVRMVNLFLVVRVVLAVAGDLAVKGQSTLGLSALRAIDLLALLRGLLARLIGSLVAVPLLVTSNVGICTNLGSISGNGGTAGNGDSSSQKRILKVTTLDLLRRLGVVVARL